MKLAIVVAVLLMCMPFGNTAAPKYTAGNSGSLFSKVHDVCCNSGKREVAVAFLEKKSASKRALWHECCWEGCGWEEVRETSLPEECVNEGCLNEEIGELCD